MKKLRKSMKQIIHQCNKSVRFYKKKDINLQPLTYNNNSWHKKAHLNTG